MNNDDMNNTQGAAMPQNDVPAAAPTEEKPAEGATESTQPTDANPAA